jgi:hypothetical protein
MSDVNFFELKGQIIKEITGLEKNSPEVNIVTNQTTYKLYHHQDCCESVFVENVIGDEKDILNEEIIFAEEDAGANDPDWYDEHYNDSHTWTKYVLKTESASLEFWFLGESNGYYNESVSIKKI